MVLLAVRLLTGNRLGCNKRLHVCLRYLCCLRFLEIRLDYFAALDNLSELLEFLVERLKHFRLLLDRDLNIPSPFHLYEVFFGNGSTFT